MTSEVKGRKCPSDRTPYNDSNYNYSYLVFIYSLTAYADTVKWKEIKNIISRADDIIHLLPRLFSSKSNCEKIR